MAHRGASGDFPEHSEAAFRAALDRGADVLEVDVVSCADGELVARHEWGLAGTTDVASRRDLASLAQPRDGRRGRTTDWWVDLMTLEQVLELRTRERWPDIRPASAARDGDAPVLRLQDVLAIAADEAERRKRPIGVAIELKDVGAAAQVRGLDIVGALLRDLTLAAAPSARVPVWVMAFEAAPLAALHAERAAGRAPDIPLVQLMERAPPADQQAWDEVRARAEVVGPSLDLALGGAGALSPDALHEDARRRDLAVWSWTFRAENAFLPPALRRGSSPADHGDLRTLVAEAGRRRIAGLICDQPELVAGHGSVGS